MLGKPRRKFLAIGCLGAGTIMMASPLASLASTPPAATSNGLSTLGISLPSVTVTDPTGVAHSVSLGTLTAKSQSLPQLLSSLTVGGTSLLGQTVPSQTFSTSSGPQSGSYSVPVPTGLPVTGSVSLGNYALSAANGTTSALLSALTGQVGVTPLNLSTTLGQHGISTQVTPTASTSNAALITPPLTLKLSDILPASVLQGLPLGVVLSLVSQLNLPLGSLGPVVSELQSLVTTVQSLDTNLTNLASAEAQLSSLASPAIQTAEATVNTDTQQVTQLQSTVASDQATVTTDQSKVTADQAAVTAAQSVVSTACVLPLSTACTTAQATLTSAQNTLTADQSSLSAAQSALTTAQSQLSAAQTQLASAQTTLNNLISAAGPAVQQAQTLVNTLTATVNGLLSQVDNLLNQLSGTNLTSLLNNLIAALGNGSLVDLGSITAVLSTAANGSSGTSTASCTPSSLSILGVSVPVPNCAAVSQAISSLGSKLDTVLQLLPVGTPKVTASGLTTSTQATPKPDSNGTTSATAALTALQLALPQMKLSGVVDQLTHNLQQQLQQLLSTLSTAGGAGSTLSLTGLNIPATLSSLANTLVTQVGALPTGAALQGLSTLGLTVNAAGVTAASTFTPASASVPNAAGTPNATPAGPAPTSSTPTALPMTGTDAVGTIAVGLLLLVVGYFLLVLTDVRREALLSLVPARRSRRR